MKTGKAALIARIAVILLAIALISVGVYREKTRDTRNKGSMICLECIGLG